LGGGTQQDRSSKWAPKFTRIEDATPWRDIEADLYLVDVYSGNSFPADAILPEHAGWKRWYAEMIDAVPRRPWGVAERGIVAGPTRAETVRREAHWLAEDPIGQACSLYLWWNVNSEHEAEDWVLDRAGVSAVAALTARFAGHAARQPVTSEVTDGERPGDGPLFVHDGVTEPTDSPGRVPITEYLIKGGSVSMPADAAKFRGRLLFSLTG
jgi:hypothetical protein